MHRIIAHLGPFTVYSYGLMLALSFAAGTYLCIKRSRRLGIESSKIIDLSLYILVSAIIGARFLFVILNWDYYKHDLLQVFMLWEGGLVFYGGFIFAFVTSIAYLKKNKIDVWKFADLFSPSLALGIAIGRIGCFLNGCCYGKISDKWGICFPSAGSPPVFTQQNWQGLVSSSAEWSLPVIPTQLYSAAAALIIFFLLLGLEKKKRPDGFIFWSFVLMYSIGRFIIEGLRYYEPNFILPFGITVSQAISAALAVLSIAMLAMIYSKARAGRY